MRRSPFKSDQTAPQAAQTARKPLETAPVRPQSCHQLANSAQPKALFRRSLSNVYRGYFCEQKIVPICWGKALTGC